jgi:hypothetical protein
MDMRSVSLNQFQKKKLSNDSKETAVLRNIMHSSIFERKKGEKIKIASDCIKKNVN